MIHGVSEDKISIKDINKNDYFKISRNLTNTELAASLKNSGMLEKPFLIKQDDCYYPFTCHNRIAIISEIDIPVLEACIIETPLYEVFVKNLLMKIYRNECGPVGRVKAFKIAGTDFGITGAELKDLARKVLKIPNDVTSDEKILNRILLLPEPLKNYIDIKDVPFKLIKDIITFDDGLIAELSKWVEKVQIRLNVFKMLIDFLFDIRRRDGKFNIIENEALSQMDDKALYDYVFRIRYPEYASKKEKADKIITMLSGRGVSVEYPEFFEKDTVSFRFTINKKEKGSMISELASGLDVKRIDELLSLL